MNYKTLTVLFVLLTISMNFSAQTVSEKVLDNVCECLEFATTVAEIEDSLASCRSQAMTFVMTEGTEEDVAFLSTVEGIRQIGTDVVENIYSSCYHVRKVFIDEKTAEFDKLSGNEEANKHYRLGTEFLRNTDYEAAILEFESAVKLDGNFPYAYDNIAICYRRMDNYKKAIKYYEKSLEIFPEGQVAIMNIAAAYLLLENYEDGLFYYNRLKYLYLYDPEGYFGAAKCLFILKEYRYALENIFTAHLIYTQTGSDYIKDSEELIKAFFADMKSLGMTELFYEVAAEYNITINE